MSYRFGSLGQALARIDTGSPSQGYRIVVNRDWWDALSETERDAYLAQCSERGVTLSADDRISRHFVELAGIDEPPLSTEHRV